MLRQLSTRPVYHWPNVSHLLAYADRALRFDPLPARDRQASKARQPAHIRRILEHGGCSAATVLDWNSAKNGKGGISAGSGNRQRDELGEAPGLHAPQIHIGHPVRDDICR